MRRHDAQPAGALEALLVHVEHPVDLDLQGMDTDVGLAVVAGRVAAGIGRVVAHQVA